MSREVQTGSREQLVRQQQILSHLGHYKGHIDGIWGPKTIAAKSAFELSGAFGPGLPNGGLPFTLKGPFPRGLRAEGTMLTCAGFDPSQWPESGGLRERTPPTGPAQMTGSLRNRPDRGVVAKPTAVQVETQTQTQAQPQDEPAEPAPTQAEEASPAAAEPAAEFAEDGEVDTAALAAKAWGKPSE